MLKSSLRLSTFVVASTALSAKVRYQTCGKELITLPNKRPPESIANDIRPIALTQILAKVFEKVFESIVLKWVDNICIPQIVDKQFGGMTQAMVEMLRKWHTATDVPGTTVRVLFLDYSKAFDMINHEILITKLVAMHLPANMIVRWMAAFLLDRDKQLRLERCRGPRTCWCILTVYANLVIFISTSMTVPYLKYAILPVNRCYSSPLPVLLIGLLRMLCELH